MKKKEKLECPVCGAYSRQREVLCSSRPAEPACTLAGPRDGAARSVDPGAPTDPTGREDEAPTEPPRVRSRSPSLEMLFCAPVGYEARYSCSHCGRLATSHDLVCLPKERGGQ